MNQTVEKIGKFIQTSILKITPPEGAKRPSTKAIYGALKAARPILKEHFDGPVKCRYAGCPPVAAQVRGQKPLKVLEYLWDFSFSQYAIPQAIEQGGNNVPQGKKYKLLFVAESELGTGDEICRDLLKLLEARTAIRCLIYKQPKIPNRRQQLHARMVRILHTHAYFEPTSESWLFIGLLWEPGRIDCKAYTLNADGSELLEI